MKKFVITGGNSGIGLDAGRQLALLGHHVILLGRDPAKGAAAVESLKSTPGKAEFHSVDLSTHAGVRKAADTLLLSPRDGKTFFPSIAYEQRILEAVPRWFQALKQIGAEPPVIIMLSLLGVKGYWMYVDPSVSSHGAREINRDQLIGPGVLAESLDIETKGRTTRNNIFDLMRPMFDPIWNACGFPRSINFDEAGNWKPRR